jgi:hypothetical protein
MVAPLVAAAARSSVARKGEQSAQDKARIVRTEAQQKQRVALARRSQDGSVANGNSSAQARLRATNDNMSNDAVNDNTPERQNPQSAAEARIARLRQARRFASQTQSSPSSSKKDSKKNPLHYLAYIPAGCVALFKDILDLIGIGSLPVIGWVVTVMASIIIFTLLLFTDASIGMSQARRILTRIGVLLTFTIVEGFAFGVNLLPLQTAAVVVIFLLDVASGTAIRTVSKVVPVGRVVRTVIK